MKQIYTFTTKRYAMKYESIDVALEASMSFVNDFIMQAEIKPKNIINIEHHVESFCANKIVIKADDYPDTDIPLVPTKLYSCVTILTYYK